MSFSIAITGKGGTGKTTLSCLIIKWLIKQGKTPVLAVDADPNSNLNEMLGINMGDTVGNVREKLKDEIKDIPQGLSKLEFVEYKINTSLVETKEYDFIAMGRPEGPGCYCYPNHMLQWALEQIMKYYRYMVIDNEAGLENLSRRIVKDIDLLLIVSDPSFRGVKTAGRILEIIEDVEIKVKKKALIINRFDEPLLPGKIKEEVKTQGLELAGIVPADKIINERDLEGEPIIDIPVDAKIYKSVEKIMNELSKEMSGAAVTGS